MKKFLKLTLPVLALALAGCASSSNPAEDQSFSESGAGEESIYDSSVAGGGTGSSSPLPARDESLNPDGADYETLSAHTVYFAFDSFSIEAGERHKVENVAKWMQSNTDKKVVVAGHCDNRGTIQYNLALGERRALAVRDYLVGLGIDKSKISTISYGEERPAVEGENEEAWSKNRRAQIGVLK
ncbi:MAG: peptidoglycan-associated lipoprotein Pal [Verrucomicrobiota bacterium]